VGPGGATALPRAAGTPVGVGVGVGVGVEVVVGVGVVVEVVVEVVVGVGYRRLTTRAACSVTRGPLSSALFGL
jgi:hypothetical protein